MTTIPGSLSFAKLVMMSSAPAKSAGETRYTSQDIDIPFIDFPLQSRLQSALGVHSFYIEQNKLVCLCSKCCCV